MGSVGAFYLGHHFILHNNRSMAFNLWLKLNTLRQSVNFPKQWKLLACVYDVIIKNKVQHRLEAVYLVTSCVTKSVAFGCEAHGRFGN